MNPIVPPAPQRAGYNHSTFMTISKPSPRHDASAQDRAGSRAAFARACELIPGGVNSPARAFGGVGGEPIFFERAAGAYAYDVDGNRYIDYVGSWGPMILGHAPPQVLEAISRAAARGTSFGAPTAGRERVGRVDH